jgi:4-amino-4-deoxy-L-arabinose transferase-like glycosyltransferase
MTAPADRVRRSVFLAIAAGLAGLGAVASAGFFSIDEVIYFMGAHALWSSGSLAVENGFAAFGSDDLKIWFLREGPPGLVPQYPVGTALAGAPLIPLFGEKALVALNLAAAIGTLVAAHALARRLFGSLRVADLSVLLLALCTFWAEYAVGHWPHSASAFFATLALWLFLGALERGEDAWRPALRSGLAVGAGMLFRVDVVLLLPAIAAATILFAARPVRVLAGGAAGLLPMAGVLSASNRLKFGTWNPLSYGASGGGTDISSHWGAALLLLAALGALVLLRPAGPRLRLALAGAGAAGLAALALSPLAPVLWKLAQGIHALLLDAAAIPASRPEMEARPDGTLLILGFPKKALGQSLPWLGCLAALAGAARGVRPGGTAIALLVVAAWMLPFLMLAWHGGFSSNMRYFLPILPVLTALGAVAILWLADRAGPAAPRIAAGGALIGLSAAVLWLALAPWRTAQLHQIASSWLLLAVAAASLLAVLLQGRVPAGAALGGVGAGLALAAFLAAGDLAAAQKRRALMAAQSEASAAIPGRVLFYGPPEGHAGAIGDPDHLMALGERNGGRIDTDLVEAACAAGYRVVAQGALARSFPPLGGRPAAVERVHGAGPWPLAEMRCPP